MPASNPPAARSTISSLGDLQFDFRIGRAERCDHRLKDQRHDPAGNGEAQEPGRTLPDLTRDLACSDEFLEGGLCTRQEAFAGLGQADAARRAYEERGADARLECAYRLTDRRWSHPEIRGRPAKIAVLGNAQERLHAIERALPDCEVLLHSPSTLSRIVHRGK
jgi:hypothetical protein